MKMFRIRLWRPVEKVVVSNLRKLGGGLYRWNCFESDLWHHGHLDTKIENILGHIQDMKFVILTKKNTPGFISMVNGLNLHNRLADPRNFEVAIFYGCTHDEDTRNPPDHVLSIFKFSEESTHRPSRVHLRWFFCLTRVVINPTQNIIRVFLWILKNLV